ncbi:MAG: tetratricopeptide repeat protein [Candidatus Kapaibacterium sp.]
MQNQLDDLQEKLSTTSTDAERFRLLCEIVVRLIPVDIRRATSYAEEGLQIARAQENIVMEGEALDLIGECYARSGRYAEGIAALEEAIHLLERTGNHHRAMVVNTNIGNTYWMVGEYEEAFARFQESHKRAVTLDSNQHLQLVKNNLGNLLLHWQRYPEARQLLEESLALSRKDGNERGIARALHNLGRARIECLEYPEGLKNLRESLELFTQCDDKPGVASVQIEIGRFYRILGDYAESIKAYAASIAISQSIGDRQSEGMGLNNIGDLYQQTGQYQDAIRHFQQSLKIKEELGNPREVANTLLNLGAVTLKLQSVEEARTIFERVKAIGEEIDDPRLLAHALTNLARISVGENNPARTETLLSKARLYVQELQGKQDWGELCAGIGEVQLEVGHLQMGINTFNSVLKFAEQTERKHLQATLHGLLSGAYQKGGDANKALLHLHRQREIEREIFRDDSDHRLKSLMVTYEVDRARAEQELAQKESEILRLKNRQLEGEIEHRRKELISTAMFLSQKNDFLRQVLRRLKLLAGTSPTNISGELRNLSGEIDSIIGTEESWNTFEQQFRDVHGDYLQTLASRFPKLTPTELKVCALIRIGLSTKEIAQILTAEPRSIDKYRQRMRKKLELDSSVNLQTFLQGIGEGVG